MNKIYIKLVAMTLILVLLISVMVVSSYAWLVLSGSPVTTGIQVAVGGSNTILTAPNIREVMDDGTVFNYPGRFSDSLNFGHQSDYAYLKDIGNLTPVSTSNGVDWFLPTYYSGSDSQVQEGKIRSGALRDVSEFRLDSELSHANLPASMREQIKEGSYVYLDFWVMSPSGNYTLRVSTGDEDDDGGSFVIDLMEPTLNADVYEMEAPTGSAAAAVRVGFLANRLMLVDGTMERYQASEFEDERVTSLRGMYQEPNTGNANLNDTQFLIYEPNGDYHPAHSGIQGNYVQTKPLGLENGEITEITAENLTVQRNCSWSMADNGTETQLEQRFEAAMKAKIWDQMNTAEIADRFYYQYLGGQIAPYVDKGRFYGSTDNLLAMAAAGNGMVQQGSLENEYMGATEDREIVKLERNVPQRIRMFIWLEGQDVDCVDNINASRFAVNIELAGGNT